jgi:hypothetical protein
MATMDSGSFANPFIAGVNCLGEIIIRDGLMA